MILKSAMIYTAPFVLICVSREIDQQLYFLTMKSHLKLSVIIAYISSELVNSTPLMMLVNWLFLLGVLKWKTSLTLDFD